MDAEQALANALDWAEGRRSWANAPFEPDVISAMDAAEVVKWSALYVALSLAPPPAPEENRDG